MNCFVCFEEKGPFLSPCLCTGTIGFIHRDCFVRWGREKCQACQQQYKPLEVTWREWFAVQRHRFCLFILEYGTIIVTVMVVIAQVAIRYNAWLIVAAAMFTISIVHMVRLYH
jgi:hypothetical protein